MSKIKTLSTILAGVAIIGCIVLVSCEKKVEGFLSDRIFYQVNPFYIQQGITAVSSSLVADGSTAPLHVEVLALRDSAGNDADSLLSTPRSIVTFKGAITYLDSTLDLLKLKLQDSLVRPFNIAETGGRLQFTAATKFVPTGSYNMDISVSNTRGTEVLQNVCTFIIGPLEKYYDLYYNRVRYWNNGTGDGGADKEVVNSALVSVSFTGGTDVSKVIYKFVDKNGKPFNPKKGEVSRWNIGYVAAIFDEYDPYYTPVLTDSTLEYQIPSYGISFPYVHTVYSPDGTESTDGNQNINPALCRYKISASANKQGQLVQSFTSLDFLAAGTYVVTVTLPDIERNY